MGPADSFSKGRSFSNLVEDVLSSRSVFDASAAALAKPSKSYQTNPALHDRFVEGTEKSK